MDVSERAVRWRRACVDGACVRGCALPLTQNVLPNHVQSLIPMCRWGGSFRHGGVGFQRSAPPARYQFGRCGPGDVPCACVGIPRPQDPFGVRLISCRRVRTFPAASQGPTHLHTPHLHASAPAGNPSPRQCSPGSARQAACSA
eukprot:365240-Chlamydomonas_euryale.AAC.1